VTDTDSRMLERVRKLLARAEHPATPAAEAQACSTKAATLMSRHVIDQAMVDAKRPERPTPETREIVVDAPYALPKAVLLSSVARAFRVCVAVGGDSAAGGRRCTVVGFPADLRMADVLFTSLLLQATTAALAATPPVGSGVRAFRRAFLFGFAATVGARLREVRQETEQEASSATPGAELVLADRYVRVQSAFTEQFPHLRTMNATVSSGTGMSAGRAAGARADLSLTQRRVDSKRQEIGA